MTLRPFLLAGVLALGACGSVPTSYYTLIPSEPQAGTSAGQPSGFQLQVMPVRIPVQVDQPSLVVRQSDGQLAILESALWAAPLADEFHDALAAELEQRFGVRDLAGLPGDPDRPLLNVRTDVRRFESLPGRHAVLDVVWSLELASSRGERRTLTCATVVQERASTELPSLVLAHQRAISTLAEQISTTARRWATGAAGCP